MIFPSNFSSRSPANGHDLLRTSVKCWAVWGAEQGSCSPDGNIAREQWNRLWSPNNRAIWAKPCCNSSSLHGSCTEMCTSLEMLWLIAGNKRIYLKATSRLLDLLLWFFFPQQEQIWSLNRSTDRMLRPVWFPHPQMLRHFCFQLSLLVFSQFSSPPPPAETSAKRDFLILA